MSQPEWVVYQQMGDIGTVYVDRTGVYPPEMDYFERISEGGPDGLPLFLRFRFPIARVSLVRDPGAGGEMCVPFGFPGRTDLPYPIHKYREWYCADLEEVASSSGRKGGAAEMRRALASEDIMARAHVYLDIGMHFGFDNLDSYPDEMEG